jgi:hypothetical protein
MGSDSLIDRRPGPLPATKAAFDGLNGNAFPKELDPLRSFALHGLCKVHPPRQIPATDPSKRYMLDLTILAQTCLPTSVAMRQI